MEIPRFWRTKKERYSLEIDLKKTNGVLSFPPRPIPVGGGQIEMQRAIDANYKRLQTELAERQNKIAENQRVEEILKKAPKPMWETFVESLQAKPIPIYVSMKEKKEVSTFAK